MLFTETRETSVGALGHLGRLSTDRPETESGPTFRTGSVKALAVSRSLKLFEDQTNLGNVVQAVLSKRLLR